MLVKMISAAAIVGGLAIPGIALASADSGTLQNYLDNPGRQQSQEVVQAPGAGAGAFGYFGKGNNLAGGANGHDTACNNSSLAGNNSSGHCP